MSPDEPAGTTVALDTPVYLLPPVETVAQAIERMDAIDSYIEQREPRHSRDGVACFNHLYGVITRRVQEGIDNGFFQDGEFLTVLDVEFANRYFDALRAGVESPDTMPRSWRVLVERRGDDRLESLQFAVAGVNAHINFDLAVALMRTWQILGTVPGSGTQRDDYENINLIFSEEMMELRQSFQDEVERALDSAASPVLDMVGNWSIDNARDAAWIVGEQLWTLSTFGIDEQPLIDRVDRLTALAGNLLLTPLQ